ncbi:MAG: ABC transporter permease [Chitinispirillaceae bacterium]
MLFELAWKNLWRNKLRSLIIMTAIALGLLGGFTASALSFGMGEQMVETVIRTRVSHLQITHPRFREDPDIQYYIPDAASLVGRLDSMPQVAAAAPRVLVNAMASSPQTALGVELMGVIPQRERELTIVDQSIVEGTFFTREEGESEAVIGQELAERLDLKAGSRVVFTFQNAEGTITGGAFRVAGIFRTPSTEFDLNTVFVQAQALAELLETELQYQQVSVLFTSLEALDTSLSTVASVASQMRVQTWNQLAPELSFISETLDVSLYIFMVVILLALAFGIVNTMLMVVLERRRELGMLMAVGMKRKTLFLLIVLETLALSLTGAVAGMVLTSIAVRILSVTGIDLSIISEGLSEFGLTDVLYPLLPWTMYPILGVMVVVIAVLSAIYPARRALKLKPAEALRT